MNRNHPITALPLASIHVDHAIQQRHVMLDGPTLDDYVTALRAGAEFPAITVFHDGRVYWLADGFHRLEAADEAGLKTLAAAVCPGTRRDAILHAVSANRAHGLRRNREDVRRAIETLLGDEEWSRWSDRMIADQVGCDHKTVGSVRRDWERQVVNSPPCNDEQSGDAGADQLGNFPSCGANPKDDDPDQLGKFPSCAADHRGVAARSESNRVAPRPCSAPRHPPAPTMRLGKDGKQRAMAPPTAPVNKAVVAMQRAHHLAAALARLDEVLGDLLPEDGATVMDNLRAALTRLEARFSLTKEGQPDA